MKLFRRISAMTMVTMLLLSLSITAFAVDYDAADLDGLNAAFGDTSGEDVNINITADVDAEYSAFFPKKVSITILAPKTEVP